MNEQRKAALGRLDQSNKEAQMGARACGENGAFAGQLLSRFQGFSWSGAAHRPLTPAGSEEDGLAPHGPRAGRASGGQLSGGCGSSPTRCDAITSPFADNKKRPCAARALLLLLSLTPTPPPLFSAPLLVRTGAAFRDSRTKGNSSLGRRNQLEEGQNWSRRMGESELSSGFQGAMETV